MHAYQIVRRIYPYSSIRYSHTSRGPVLKQRASFQGFICEKLQIDVEISNDFLLDVISCATNVARYIAQYADPYPILLGTGTGSALPHAQSDNLHMDCEPAFGLVDQFWAL